MRALLALATIGLIARSPAAGQAEPPAIEALLNQARLEGRTVRLTAERARIIGTITALSSGSAIIDGASGSRTIAVAGIDTLWTRDRATRTGALLGGVAGAITGGVLGYMVGALCDAADCRPTGEVAVIGGVIGIPLGMVAGALVGSVFPYWRRRAP